MNGFLLVSLTDTLDTMEHVRTTYSTIVQVFQIWAKTFQSDCIRLKWIT